MTRSPVSDEWAVDARPAGRVMIKAGPTAAEVGDADSFGTITFGIAGSVSMTDFANFFGGIRIYGDD